MRRSSGLLVLAMGIVMGVLGLTMAALSLTVPKADVAIILVPSLLVLLAGAVLVYAGVRIMRGATPIGAKPKGQIGNYLVDVPESRLHGGKPYEVLYKPPVSGKQRRPSKLIVRVPAATPSTLRFDAKNWFDRLCLTLGIARQVEIGDQDFVEAVYVRGSSCEYAEQYLEDQPKREAVLTLMQQGFCRVRLTCDNVEAVWTGFHPKKNDYPGLTEEAAESVFVLADKLPWDGMEHISARPDSSILGSAFLWLFVFVFAATGVCMFVYPPVRTGQLIVAGLAAFAVVYPLFGVMAGLLLRGTLTSHDRWGRLMGWGVFLIGFGGFGALAGLNALADHAPTNERTVLVLNKSISTGRRGSKSYHIVVPDWDMPRNTLGFNVSGAEYDVIVPGKSKLELTTGSGWLGIEWVKGRRVQP